VTGSPVRRVGAVLLVYAVVGVVVLIGAGWLRQLLALPDLFEELLRGGLLLGVPVAAVVAWRYPTLGDGGAAQEREGR
jgi:hypothetical protein